jgi:hypothetical protein
MPTIYNVIPKINGLLIHDLHDFMKADNGRFWTWEISVFIPAVNLFLHYFDGANEALKRDNYIATMSNVRGLIESLAVIVYDGTARLPQEAYEEFTKNGRLVKWSVKKKRWHPITSKELIAHLEDTMRLKVKHVYDDCCDMLHFSSKHMALLGGPKSQSKSGNIVDIAIGIKDQIPPAKQKELIDFCVEAATLLSQCIKSGTEEKKKRELAIK